MSKPQFYSALQSDVNSYKAVGDAGILSFTSKNVIYSFVKELTQNSLDAALKSNGKVKIRVSQKELAKSFIPDFDSLVNIVDYNIAACKEKGNYDQYKEFFKHAKKSLKGKIPVLAFEDFNTSGLVGDDNQGTFFACVNSEGVSQKASADSRGKFGIGKNAAFTLSPINTAFYSSLDNNGNVKFKGVTKLGNYKTPNGKYHSARVYYGKKDAQNVFLIDKDAHIPQSFRRNKDEGSGLSQYILGAQLPTNWEEKFIKAFLDNYWFLFFKGQLEVEVGSFILNQKSYKSKALELFEGIALNNKSNPLPYIMSLENGQKYVSDEIEHIGRMCLHLLEASDGQKLPNKILRLRGGMKIMVENPGVHIPGAGVAGVMYCLDEKGNKTLGDMEPHTHDEFRPEMLRRNQNSQGLTVTQGNEALKSITRFKVKILNGILDRYSSAPQKISIVDELFSNINSNVSGEGKGVSSSTNRETGLQKNRKLKPQKIVFSSDSKNYGVKIDDIYADDGDGGGNGDGKGGTYPRNGGSSRRKRKKHGGASEGQTVKGKMEFILAAKFIFSSKTQDGNNYKLVVRVEEDIEALDLIIGQIGASSSKSNPMSSNLISVKENGTNKSFKVHKKDKIGAVLSYRIKDLKASQSEPLMLDLEFKESLKYSSFKLIDAL